jgi:glucose/mannose transport system substrate-binding protein
MYKAQTLALACAALLAGGACTNAMAAAAQAAQTTRPAPKAEVIHWWTSGGESAAVKQVAQAYRAAGGVWVDTAIAGGDQSRAVTINRIVGGNPPTAAQFNTSKQFSDVIEQGMLNNVDEVARAQNWDKLLPEPIVKVIKVDGHYYAVPLNIHMQAWIWYSKAAFQKAGIAREPASVDEFFAALDKLKAAGIVPLAHGGQAWQETILFTAMLSNLGGKDLYLKVLRDRDQRAIASPAFRNVLLAYKRLQGYTDPRAPGRNWNDATAMVISGRAGMQIMGQGRVHGGEAGAGPAVRLHRRPRAEFSLPDPGRRVRLPENRQRQRRAGAKAARQCGGGARHPACLQPPEGVDPGAQRRRRRAGRPLRAEGDGDHEGPRAPPRRVRGLPDARPERRPAGCADRLLEHRHDGR